MDVRAENRGRPHQKLRFSVAPVMGRNFLTQERPGVRVRNVRGKSGPKSLCLCCFFYPTQTGLCKFGATLFWGNPKGDGRKGTGQKMSACQAARSSVHEIGPQSSELAVRFAKEKGIPVTFFFFLSPSRRPLLVFGLLYYFACSPETFCEYFFRVCLGILH